MSDVLATTDQSGAPAAAEASEPMATTTEQVTTEDTRVAPADLGAEAEQHPDATAESAQELTSEKPTGEAKEQPTAIATETKAGDEPSEQSAPPRAQVTGNPGFVKVTVDQAGRVGIWTAKPNSILHMHSDDTDRPAKVTVTGATAGYAFGVREAGSDACADTANMFEMYAEENAAVISAGATEVARFASDGSAKIPGKVHAEAFESTSSRAAKSNIEALSAEQAFEVLNGLDAVSFQFKRSGEKHVGFIAEDVPDAVASVDHTAVKVMDVVSVLSCCVKTQSRTIDDLRSRLERLEERTSK